jgi:hypothetical protein
MSAAGWRYAAASVVGTSHLKFGSSCQDANDCHEFQLTSGESVLVGVVADGAGSAKSGGEGAAVTCNMFVDLVSDYLSGGNTIEQIVSDTARFWLEVIRSRLCKEAETTSQELRDYACTFLGAVVGESCAAFVQVGDGVIVVSDLEEKQYGHIFWPDRGEYENTTHFLTEDQLHEHIQFDSVHRKIVELAILSDGLQRLALDYRSQTTHHPFFQGLFPPFDKLPSGRSEALSRSLVDFLSSPKVNQRTDDDKTLLLATRRTSQIDSSASVAFITDGNNTV